MRGLVYNDLHLKPAASDYDVDALAVPKDVETLASVNIIEVGRQLDRSPNEIARWREEAQNRSGESD